MVHPCRLRPTARAAGDLAPFAPFLRLGEVVHVGKGTAFGLGKYRLGSMDYLSAARLGMG